MMKMEKVIEKMEDGYKVFSLFGGYCDELEDEDDVKDAYADFVYKVEIDETIKEICLFVDTDE